MSLIPARIASSAPRNVFVTIAAPARARMTGNPPASVLSAANDDADLMAIVDRTEAERRAEAEVDAAAFAEKLIAVRALGYFPVPVTSPDAGGPGAGKAPRIKDWQKLALTADADQYRRWARQYPDHRNIGILCDPMCAADLDIDDLATADAIEALCFKHFGFAPVRRRAKSARRLLPYVAANGPQRKRVIPGVNGKIEFLSQGQQFVAFGKHPLGAELEWWVADCQLRGPGPCAELTAITEAQIDAFEAEAIELLGGPAPGTKPTVKAGKASHKSAGDDAPSQESLVAIDARALVQIVLKLPNGSAFNDRNAWITMAHALAAALPNHPDVAEKLWLKWCEQRPQNDGEPERVWESLTGPHHVGAQWIIARAQEARVDVSAYQGAEFAATASGKSAPNDAATPGTAAGNSDKPDDDLSVRDKAIIAVQSAGATFWRDGDYNGFVTLPRGDALQRYRVQSRAFGRVVRRLYGQTYPVKVNGVARPGSLGKAALDEVLQALDAMAAHSDIVRELAVRVHGAADGSVWIDLGTPAWSAVRVTAEGWQVVASADVPLIRPEGMRPLPIPIPDPDALARLRSLLNLPGTEHDDAFKLMVAWCVACFYPTGPYPLLALDGEQGSGKSTACRMLRKLVDPNIAPLRAIPKSEDDMLISCVNGRVVALDNMSYITAGLADSLCRVLTGAGFGKRSLYSNGEEYLGNVCRPALINGIPSLMSRGDLADRSLPVTLPAIPDDQRRPESEVWRDFDAAHPGIFAVILDGLTTALRRLPTLHLASMPRMADFARLACAAAPAFGWTAEEMLSAIIRNRDAVVATVLEADPLANAIQAFVAEVARPGQDGTAESSDLIGGARTGKWSADAWSGTASELLGLLGGYVGQDDRRARTWPKDGTRLSTRLRRLAPALRRNGVEVTQEREGGTGKRILTVRPVPEIP